MYGAAGPEEAKAIMDGNNPTFPRPGRHGKNFKTEVIAFNSRSPEAIA
jgi:hypothetical protein